MNSASFAAPVGDKEQKYKALLSQIDSLIIKEDNVMSSLSNLTAIFKSTFERISWVGFYLYDGQKLYLGPFQGNLACTNIEIGKGVCGLAAKNRETIVVPDVEKFPGHIACDTRSKSEIVIPIVKNDELFGVLDLDSYAYNSFDDIDKTYLEKVIDYLVQKIL
ncbi:MAG TPA: GAF domain-containing protein [Ignavibacteriaceae bacterium]|nr:GAF domain-containing protein [Ignavibacteriaceae bacterium]